MVDLGWDLFRSREMSSVLWSPMSTWMTGGYNAFYATLRRLIIGRELTVRSNESAITLTMVEFDGHPGGRALSVGQFGDIAASARDVTYDHFHVPRIDAVLRNFHFHPGSPAQLVAAPVDLEVNLSSESVSALTRNILGPVTVSVDGRGVGRISWKRAVRIGYVEVGVAIVGATLMVTPHHLVVRGRRWALPRWLPGKPIVIPPIHGMLVKEVTLQADSVRVGMQLPEWRIDLSQLPVNLVR